MAAQPGRRDEVVRLMSEGLGAMPGCQLYVVGASAQDSDVLVITEIWSSEEAHRASLELPEVRAAIERALPLLDRSRMTQHRFVPAVVVGA